MGLLARGMHPCFLVRLTKRFAARVVVVKMKKWWRGGDGGDGVGENDGYGHGGHGGVGGDVDVDENGDSDCNDVCGGEGLNRCTVGW